MWDETNDRWSTNSQPLAVSSLVAAGAASGITTLAAGNTTITGFANVTTTIQGGSSLTIAGAASGITTLAAGNTTITGFINATSTGTFASTLQVGNNSGGVDATLHIKSVQGGNGRFLQFSPQANSVNALALMASSNSTGGEQWWSIGSQTDDTFKIQKGVGFGGAGLSISNTGGIVSSDVADAVGYKGLPQNAKTAAYGLILTDMGKMINTTTGGVVIPANANVAFPLGSTIVIYNNSASSQTISITTDTIYLAGTATTGSRTLAQRGLATCVKVASTTWVVSGAGVT